MEPVPGGTEACTETELVASKSAALPRFLRSYKFANGSTIVEHHIGALDAEQSGDHDYVFTGSYAGIVGRRGNGWAAHRANLTGASEIVTRLDPDTFPMHVDYETGVLTAARELERVSVQTWRQGRAPWGYRHTQIHIVSDKAAWLAWNASLSHPTLPGSLRMMPTRSVGEITTIDTLREGESIAFTTLPAHVQGAEAFFQCKISISVDSKGRAGPHREPAPAKAAAVAGQESKVPGTAEAVDRLGSVRAKLQDLLDARDSAGMMAQLLELSPEDRDLIRQPNPSTGQALSESLQHAIADGDSSQLALLRTLVCPNAKDHCNSRGAFTESELALAASFAGTDSCPACDTASDIIPAAAQPGLTPSPASIGPQTAATDASTDGGTPAAIPAGVAGTFPAALQVPTSVVTVASYKASEVEGASQGTSADAFSPVGSSSVQPATVAGVCGHAASTASEGAAAAVVSEVAGDRRPPSPECWLCGSAVADPVAAELVQGFARVLGEDRSTANPARALFERGVSVDWLVAFTDAHECWSWPTWRVAANLVKPATRATKCRFVDLPTVRASAEVGPADVFISHAWGGSWGSLVAAATQYLSRRDRVWIDVFAVRQWAGNYADLAFDEVVKRVRAILVVVGSVERISNLSTMEVLKRGVGRVLRPEERKSIPFFRVWCIVEIATAISQGRPLTMACGEFVRGKGFVPDVSQLFHLQFLVDIEEADATFAADKERILGNIRSGVQPGVTIASINQAVSASIVGALHSAHTPMVGQYLLGHSTGLDAALACLASVPGEEESATQVAASEPTEHQLHIARTVDAAVLAGAACGCLDLIRAVVAVRPQALQARDAHGRTLLMLATAGGHSETIHELLRAGADPNLVCEHGWSAVAYGSRTLTADLLEALKLSGFSRMCAPMRGGITPLVLAIQDGNFDLARVCVAEGADIEARDGIGYTALAHAVSFCRPEITSFLLEAGADVHAIDNWGQSILGWAVEGGSAACVDLLLRSGSVAPLHIRPWMTQLDQADEALAKAVESGNPTTAADMREIVSLLERCSRPAFGRIRELVCKSSSVCCPADPQSVAALVRLGLTEEQAGIALYSHSHRMDCIIEDGVIKKELPVPGELVDVHKWIANNWRGGLVTAGPDWCHTTEEGSATAFSRVGLATMNSRGVVQVSFLAADGTQHSKSNLLCGLNGKSELRWAGYEPLRMASDT